MLSVPPEVTEPHTSQVSGPVRLVVQVVPEAQVTSRAGPLYPSTKPLQEVGEMFQVTRERIRQIEEKALLKLRSPYRSSKLREFADFVSTN